MMMQSCSVCNVVGGSCSCGWFHNQSINSFSMLFSGGPNNTNTQNYFDTTTNYQSDIYSSSSSYYSASPLPAPAPPYSSVDCTLSLGTPSTRLSNNENCSEKRRSSCVSKFCSWDFLKHGGGTHESSSSSSQKNNNNNRASNYYPGGDGGGDSLSARRCANCDTTSTPLWRNGPKGPKSLCNACGIRHKKEERRASAAAAAAAAATNDSSAATGGAVDTYHMNNSSSWVHQYSQNQKLPYFSSAYSAAGNEFRFMEEEDAREADGIPYLSWRFNVADNRPAALVHDFTR